MSYVLFSSAPRLQGCRKRREAGLIKARRAEGKAADVAAVDGLHPGPRQSSAFPADAKFAFISCSIALKRRSPGP
jgi:hypothetical protein